MFTAADVAPTPLLVCPDSENGCDRTFLDPTDPTGRYGPDGDGGDPLGDPLGLLTGTHDTNDYSRQTGRGSFTALNWNAVRNWDGSAMPEGGVVGIDHELGQPGQKAEYGPCHTGPASQPDQHPDSYKGACASPESPLSYTLVKNWFKGNQTNFANGVFVGNASTKATCAAPCQHWWGQRSQRVDAELWPKYDGTTTTDVNYVRVRFAEIWNEFTAYANGGTYGPAIGQIRLAKIGQPGIGTLGGQIKRGVNLVTHVDPQKGPDVTIRMWPRGAPGLSTGGQPLQSFATPGNNTSGVYTSGALYADYYRVLVIDHVSGKCRKFERRQLSAGGWRMDFDVSKDDFGQGMVPC